MRSIFLVGALSALCFASLSAQQTVVFTSAAGAGGEGRFADGAAWPTAGGFTFEVGLFPAGFDPAKEAPATWSAAWTALRPSVAAAAVTSWYRDGSSTLFSISSISTSGPAVSADLGEQYYVWGANARVPHVGTEWILLTNPAWRRATGGTARLPDMFDTTDTGTIAVIGELLHGGRDLRSAPAFTGELRLIGQVADFAVLAGEPATLSVKAGGAGFSYQWYTGAKGDTSRPLAGARKATYTLPSVPRTATFWVRLSDGVKNLDSETITVTATEAGTGITATQTFSADARSGEPVEIRAEVNFAGAPSRVDFAALLPPGWLLVGSESAGAHRRPAAGATELIEWSWLEAPTSPLRLRYTVLPPPGLSAATALTALVTVERGGITSRQLVQPQ